jgi:REP element-mobilizing transposase RayT
MSRPHRGDEAGIWFHIMNRGIARRPVFELRADVRRFLAGLARAVRRGEIEVHAYCVLTTHFHLLVRSLGGLSEAMRRVQNEYVRWFNRGRGRDGPLFRGRFLSKPVRSLTYRILLVRYIDANPVRAGLVEDPWEHPYGSAPHYLRGKGPPWLARGWVEQHVAARAGGRRYEPAAYPRVFGPSRNDAEHELVERRLLSPCTVAPGEVDPLDDLLEAGSERFLERMLLRALLADGTRPGIAVCDPGTVMQLHAAEAVAGFPRRGRGSRRPFPSWIQERVVLLRGLCGLSLAEIARRTTVSVGGVAKILERHRSLLNEDPKHRERIGQLGARAARESGIAFDLRAGGAAVEESA